MPHTTSTVRCPSCRASLATFAGGTLDFSGARVTIQPTGGTVLYCATCSTPKVWQDRVEMRQQR